MQWLVEFQPEGPQAGLRLYDHPGGRLLGEVGGAELANLGFANGPPDAERTLTLAATLLGDKGEEGAVATASLPAPANGRRRKLWELPPAFHCTLIGTCLGASELRKLAPRVGVRDAPALTDYELHGLFVRGARARGAISHRLHKLLERKYAASLRRFARARDEAALEALWAEAWEQGTFAGPLWAVMSHGAAGEALLWRVYGEIHMLSHQVGAANRADLRRLARAEQGLEEARLQVEALRRRVAEAEQGLRGASRSRVELNALRERTLVAERRVDALLGGREWIELERARQEAERRRAAEADRAARLEVALGCREEELMRLRDRTGELEHELMERGAGMAALERQLDRLFDDTSDCPDGCPAEAVCRGGLAGRRVLCVGGRARLTPHYRALVEGQNGRFLHHDGGLEESAGRLQGLLASADVVICPADCVSHDAYYRVKGFCKRTGKPCLMLDGSGISSFARALDGLATLDGGGAGEGGGVVPVPRTN
ncbi:DUF2325 domain-containing protein [Endothiovibrio diazotrophicus]